MKFINLLKKELKELLTPQVFIGMIATVVLLIVMGEAMGGFIEEEAENFNQVTICNQDDNEFTNAILTVIEQTGTEVTYVDLQSDKYEEEIDRLGIKAMVIIPQGFADAVLNGEKGELITVSKMTSLSSMANLSSDAASNTVNTISEAVKITLYSEMGLSQDDILQLETPVNVTDKTVVGNRIADVSTAVVQSVASLQGMFVPIVIFVLVVYAAQMIMAAISTEKIDKTLETLLSAPVSRLSVLLAKMSAAGVVAALNAIVYMFGFNKMMDGMTGNLMASEATEAVVSELGLNLAGMDYILLGVQMFLTILITLCVALMLGALAKDTKSSQTLLMPIMVTAMIPYFVTMMMDVKTLPAVLKYIVYAIPFTHTFTATENILMDNMNIYFMGLAYQVVLFIICMFLAVRLFMTDKIFTMTIDFTKKASDKKKNKNAFSIIKK